MPSCRTLNLLELIKNAVLKLDASTELDIKKVVPALNALLVNVNDPILPPVNNTLLPVISPDAFILNFDADIKNSLFSADPDKKNPDPVIASRVIANPPMFPVVAFMLPVILTEPLNNADEAVTSPFALTLNFDDDIKKSLPVALPDIEKLDPLDNELLLIVNPPILPAVAAMVPPTANVEPSQVK